MRVNSNRTSNKTALTGTIFQLADGNIQSCNPDAEEILGYSARQIIEADYFQPPWQTIHQDGSNFPPETHPGINALRTGQGETNVVMGFYRPEKSLVWLSVNARPLFTKNSTRPYGVAIEFSEIADPSPEVTSVIAQSETAPLTLLVVDDNPYDREVYRRYLQKDPQRQYNLLETETGESALALAAQRQPDLILLDYLLPDFDGLEWLRAWQEGQQDPPPVIVLTGKGDENIAIQSLKLGAVDYLVKRELTAEKLQLAVKRAITEAQLNQKYQVTLLNLRREQKFIKQITNAVPGVIYIYDAIAQQNLYTNFQIDNLLGYSPQQLASMGDNFLPQVMHPEDFQRFSSHLAILNRAETEQVCSFEYRMRHHNGEWRWFCSRDRVYSRTDDGSLEQILGVAQDITPRKKIEAELVKTDSILRSIINDSSSIIFVKDLEGRYLIANQSAADFLGIEIADMLGKNDIALFPAEVAQTVMASDRQVIEAERSWSAEEVFNQEISRVLLTNKYPWRDVTGKIAGVIGICQDVTALRRSQQQLQEKEQLLSLALSSANAGTWSWEIDTGTLIWSSENYQLYGLNPQQSSLQYQDWKNTLYPEDRDKIEQEIQKFIAQESAQFNTEFRIVHPQLGMRWISAIGNVTFDDQGKPFKLSGINLDITERKLKEEQLRRNEQHLRRVLDSLYSFVGVLTPDGTLIEVNRTALEAANLQLEDVLGKPFAQTYWWSYASEIQAQLNNAIERATAGETIRYDVEIRLNPEHYILIDFSLTPLFDEANNVEYLIPSGIDITEREKHKQALKKSKDELRLITEVIPQQVWTALPNGEVDYLNQRWQDYTGVGLKALKTNGWSAIVHPDDLERVNQTWSKAIETNGNYNIKARLRRADGTYHWFLGRARPLHNEEGEIIKWYGTNTDISRIKNLEEKLRQQTQDLTKANQIKDEFLAIVSHELRTPLNPILGWAQLIATGRLNAEKQAMGIEIIQRNAKLQAQLIDDLLDVSRILRGKLDLQVSPVNLAIVIKSALATVQLAAEAKSIEIITELATDIGQVAGDPGRLQQIVWNLVSNAIKFTPEGGKVTVKLREVYNQAQIQVIDTGQGIDAEFLPYVFDRFRQAESNSTRKFGGLGLGLAIVRYLTELHGGTVNATSPGEEQGSTFTVKLPLMNLSRSEASDNNFIKESVQPNRLNNLSVLVVEDEPDSRDILTLVLEQEGAEVTAVVSAPEALELFNTSNFELIISDIGMPDIDGYTLMKQIRQLPQGKDIPAIALSAYAGEVDREHSLAAGYQHHLSKPIVIPELMQIITELVE